MSTADGSKTPEEIRAEIERTRAGLSYDVDTLADKVNPSSIAQRQTDKVKGKFSTMKESVMGTAHSGTSSRPTPRRGPSTRPARRRTRPSARPRATPSPWGSSPSASVRSSPR